jgi:hypothetical protein
MDLVLKVVYKTAFLLILCVGYLSKFICFLFLKLGLMLQALVFELSRQTTARRQRTKLKRIEIEHTQKHWKELIYVLELELEKYRDSLNVKEYLLLKSAIKLNFKRLNLKNLTKLHDIFFEDPNSEVVSNLRNFLKNGRHYY